jgi:hypothetical protein
MGRSSVIREFWLYSRESWYLTQRKASDECTDKYGWLYANDSGYNIKDGLFYNGDEYPSVMKKKCRII